MKSFNKLKLISNRLNKKEIINHFKNYSLKLKFKKKLIKMYIYIFYLYFIKNIFKTNINRMKEEEKYFKDIET